MPSSFPPVASHGLVVGTRGSLGRNSPLPIPEQWHPRALHCLRAYQLPKLGSALPGNSPSTPTWQAGVPGPFPGYPHPLQCPRGLWRSGPRISGSPVPSTLSWPPMGPWPTAADLPVARGTHSAILTIRSHAPNPSTGLLHPSKMGSSLHSHQQQNDFHFVNLANPLTHITLTPGSLGRESLLPPNHSSHHAFHIHSIHSDLLAPLTQ